MTTAKLANDLRAIAAFLERVGGLPGTPLIGVAAWLEGTTEKNLKSLLKKLSGSSAQAPSSDRHGGAKDYVRDLLPTLEAGRVLLVELRKKEKEGEGIAELVSLLRPCEGMTVQAALGLLQAKLVAANGKKAAKMPRELRHELVEKYVTKIKSVIGKEDGFSAAIGELEKDKSVREAEADAIARALLTYPPSKMTRKKAISALKDLHQASVGFDRHLKATSGRSAA